MVLRDGRTLIGFLRSIDQFGKSFVTRYACAIITFSKMPSLLSTVLHAFNIAVAIKKVKMSIYIARSCTRQGRSQKFVLGGIKVFGGIKLLNSHSDVIFTT